MAEIRALLAGVEPSYFIAVPPGYVPILRGRVEEAGGDVEAIDVWVVENGGAIRRTKPIQSRGLGGGRLTPRVVPAEAYYVVPKAALRG